MSEPVGNTPSRRSAASLPWAALAVLVVVSTAATALASRRTSTTFDEIIMMAGGARGFQTGLWNIAPEHPPGTQYLYGLPIHLTQPSLPAVERTDLGFDFRYLYARDFFWSAGNDPERLAFLGRLMGALCVAGLVVAVFLFTRKRFGDTAAIVAAGLTAFTPDVLAHGGVAYNDLPLALAYFLAAWSIDSAVREPTLRRGAVAGACFALAMSIKFSAVIIPAVAVLLIIAQGISNWNWRWLGRVGLAVLAATIASYALMVLVYRGDFLLEEMRYGIEYTFRHVSRGHGAPGFLVGDRNRQGWWYFYPLAFLYKTPAAFHFLLLAGLVGLSHSRFESIRSLAASPMRVPVLAGAVFLAALLRSNLVIGFRYALPALPLLAVIVAVGLVRLWPVVGRVPRYALAGLGVWMVAATLSAYPHFLAYTSEWGGDRDRAHELLVDSSTDWGQGLLELRKWMNEQSVDRVYLSYFGSAVPSGYGIAYEPLPSFIPLASLGPPAETPPEYVVISATNLQGVYLGTDPFARFRSIEPDTVLGHTMLVYRIDESAN